MTAASQPVAGTRARAARTERRHTPRIIRAVAGWMDRPLASFHLLMGVFVLMLGFGLLMVLSSSATTAFHRSDSAFAIFTNQVTFAALGLVAFLFVVRLPLQLIRTMSTAAILVALALLVAVLVPGIGSEWNGARSWISIGSTLQFQPSEVAKLALLLWSAHVLASVRSPYRRLRSLLIPVAPVFALMVALVMLQPDLGTTVTLAIVFFSVLFFAGAQLWIFGAVAGIGLAGVLYLATSAGYRLQRVTAWLHPDQADPRYTYQSFQGLYAMGSGGLFGVGLGQSKMKWGRLPMADSDFIFAIIGEELGLIGTLTVILLFAVLAFVGLRIAHRNVDPFIKIAAAASTVWLVGQATINIGYVVGLLPVTGITLPMFSAGGTSLVVTMVVFGLLANFARREPQAAAALHGPSRRRLAGFFGIRTTRVAAPRRSKRPAKRIEREREARRARRASRDGEPDEAMRSAAPRGRSENRASGGRRSSARRSSGRKPAGDSGRRPSSGRSSAGSARTRASSGGRGSPAARAPRSDGPRSARGGANGSRGAAPDHRVRQAFGFPAPAPPKYRLRRAFGFPTPRDRRRRDGSGRAVARQGRTVRP